MSASVVAALAGSSGGAPADAQSPTEFLEGVRVALEATADILYDDDLQAALFTLYALTYGGIEGVDDRLEWDTTLIEARVTIEKAFEAALRERVPMPASPPADAESVAQALFTLTDEDTGPSLSRFIARKATNEQAEEYIVQRSVYQLMEADPHTWAIPRLRGGPKAALVEIQSDEYGGGRPERIHAELFARTMRSMGLDDQYGAYVDAVPAITLASFNEMSMFGLQRRLRGAICGHLAAYEMTSSIPSKLLSGGFRRLGYGPETTAYFDEHVEADAVHEQIAGRDLAGGLAEQEPELLGDILFGAAAYLSIDGLVSTHMIDAWESGRSSLRLSVDRAA